jgi:hypothetical protein
VRHALLGLAFAVAVGGVSAAGSGPRSQLPNDDPGAPISDSPSDPTFLLDIEIPELRAQRDSLLGISPLKPLHETTDKAKERLYKRTHLRLGLSINHLFQWISDSLPDTDRWGTASALDFVGSWEVLNRGKPTQGEVFFGVQGRWDYGTTGPQDLGSMSLASQIGTANTYAAYNPTFIIRNLYWEQGSKEAGWAYRIGKITPDAILGTSRHLTSATTFLTTGSTGVFTNGLPDSGIGAVGVWYPTPRWRLLGLISDANADRYDFGCPGCGQYYYAFEVGAQIAPKTEKAGYSKFTIWHNDGTRNGAPSNGSTGKEGWGFTTKLEHELTKDGDTIGIARYGRSYDQAAVWKQHASLHLLLYSPPGPAGLRNDVVGIGGNWLQATAEDARDEYDVELFYRFPLFTGFDTTLAYQYDINPAMTREINAAHVLSLRFRAVF